MDQRLTISYGGNIVFDGDVLACTFSLDEDGVKVAGRITAKPQQPNGADVRQAINRLKAVTAAARDRRNGAAATKG